MKSIAVGIGVAVSLVTHVYLGWMWSVSGAFMAGILVSRFAGWTGMVTLVMSWGMLIAWNLAIATEESFNMMETMGELLGGMPGVVIPLATLLIAGLLGFLAGAVGGALKKGLKPGKST